MEGGRRLARNTLWNLMGLGAPMLAALIATPLLIRGLGVDRFGVLTMAWGIIGYFSLFDLGLGRALTQLVAERLGTEREAEVPVLAWTALAMMTLLGVAAALLIAVLTPWLTGQVLKIPASLREESATTFYLLAASLPVVTSMAGLRGMLEAKQRFGALNAIRLPMGLFTFFGPLAVLPFSTSLVPVTAVLIAGRVLAGLVHLWLCLRVTPELRSTFAVDRVLVRPLLRFGGWMTASNVASALMVYLDRFLIGTLLSLSAVAYYVTPYEMMWRITLIPGALLGVLFPAFASRFRSGTGQTERLFDRGGRMVFLVMFPLTLVLVVLARDALHLWLGGDFAEQSTRVMQWMAVGVFLVSLGMLAATALQGVGLPEVTGKLNLMELPFYLVALWWLVREYGIVGAAVAWALRAGVDAALLGILAQRAALVSRGSLRRMGWLVAGALPIFAAAATLESLTAKAVFLFALLLLFPVVAWWLLLAPEERAGLRVRLSVHFNP